ncbi:hypothetical protein [Capnocytophaga canimorsus]|uniref:hypothetical protein n=1 Tax=Capnocytophaga canimorsus TaxID=28188 RepID=UPI001EDEA022|nr:hypothetical protein [Capnocytophaga canimorsus]GJQ05382.1 hypothetical protein CAPN009_17970 [Capnocytophaga canimorsus]
MTTEFYNECFVLLKMKGYDPIDLGNFIRFQKGGVVFILHHEQNDGGFLRIDARFGEELVQKHTVLKVLVALNLITRNKKIVKGYIDNNNNTILSTEILLDTTPDAIDLLPRLIMMLMEGAYEFLEIIDKE